MKLVRWSPLGLHSSRDLDRFLDSFLTSNLRGDSPARFAPPVELVESAEAFVIRLDLPGVAQNDVKVQLAGDALTIRGERKSEHDEKQGSILRSERVYGSFERSFTLATPVRGDQVRATYKDGVLEVRIPKAEAARVREIQVQAE